MNRLPLHQQPTTFQHHICQTPLLDCQLLEGALFLLKCLPSSILKQPFASGWFLRLSGSGYFDHMHIGRTQSTTCFPWGLGYPEHPEEAQRMTLSEARATLETEMRDRTGGWCHLLPILTGGLVPSLTNSTMSNLAINSVTPLTVGTMMGPNHFKPKIKSKP